MPEYIRFSNQDEVCRIEKWDMESMEGKIKDEEIFCNLNYKKCRLGINL